MVALVCIEEGVSKLKLYLIKYTDFLQKLFLRCFFFVPLISLRVKYL